jgi:hypothetical protein
MSRRASRIANRRAPVYSVSDYLAVPRGASDTCTESDPIGRGHRGVEIGPRAGYSQTDWERAAELEATIQRTNENLGEIFLGPFADALDYFGPGLMRRSGNSVIRAIGWGIGLYESTHGQIDDPEASAYLSGSSPSSATTLGDYSQLAKDIETEREFNDYGRRERAERPDHWKDMDRAAERKDHERNIGRPDTQIA